MTTDINLSYGVVFPFILILFILHDLVPGVNRMRIRIRTTALNYSNDLETHLQIYNVDPVFESLRHLKPLFTLGPNYIET
jgi:hypothetical protein